MYLNYGEFLANKLKDELLLDDTFICDYLGLTQAEFEELSTKETLNDNNLERLANRLSLKEEDFLSNTINWKEVRKNHTSNKKEIEAKYTVGAGTYMSSIRAIVYYLENKTNEKTSKGLLDNFSINKETLLDDSQLVNTQFIEDVLDYCASQGLINYNDISMIALFSLSRNKDLISFLKKERFSEKNLGRFIANHSESYEKNFNYKFVDIDNNHFMITSKSRPEINEALNSAKVTETKLNFWKREIINHTFTSADIPNCKIIDLIETNTKSYQEVHYLIKKQQSSHLFQ